MAAGVVVGLVVGAGVVLGLVVGAGVALAQVVGADVALALVGAGVVLVLVVGAGVVLALVVAGNWTRITTLASPIRQLDAHYHLGTCTNHTIPTSWLNPWRHLKFSRPLFSHPYLENGPSTWSIHLDITRNRIARRETYRCTQFSSNHLHRVASGGPSTRRPIDPPNLSKSRAILLYSYPSAPYTC